MLELPCNRSVVNKLESSNLSNTLPEKITKTLILDRGDPEDKRQELYEYFHHTYNLYERLFETLSCESAWYKKAIPLRHPLIFYFGHTAAFFINKLVTGNLINERVDQQIESRISFASATH